MCTAITVQTPQREVYFGRTMDFSYQLEPELYFIPKGYEWKNLLNTHKIRNQYSFMGIGQDISRIIFADGVNEMGFAAAMLYFPGYAVYDPIASPDSRGFPLLPSRSSVFCWECAILQIMPPLCSALSESSVRKTLSPILSHRFTGLWRIKAVNALSRKKQQTAYILWRIP